MTVVKLTRALSLWKCQAATFTLRLRMRPVTNRELSCVKFRQSRSGVMFAKLFLVGRGHGFLCTFARQENSRSAIAA